MDIGQRLEALYGSATSEVVLIAPFIKLGALTRLLAAVPDSVLVKCVTRWRPEEIAAGVSDIEIWHVVKARPEAVLSINLALHAKYYRSDDACLVGSANVTATALGWTTSPNLELLIGARADMPEILDFEEEAFSSSVMVDDDIYRAVQASVDTLTPALSINPTADGVEHVRNQVNSGFFEGVLWLPQLRNPASLYQAYSGDFGSLTEASRAAARSDLRRLQVPDGLNREAFDTYVRAVLLQEPTIRKIDSFVHVPQRFGAVRDLLRAVFLKVGPDFDADRAWQTAMRWLLYFFPGRYVLNTPNYSEVFEKVTDAASR